MANSNKARAEFARKLAAYWADRGNVLKAAQYYAEAAALTGSK